MLDAMAPNRSGILMSASLMPTRIVTLLLLICPLLPAQTRQLFNGKDLSDWKRIPRHEDAPADQPPGFVVKDGLLVSTPQSAEDDIWYTREKIGNAVLHIVYKVTAANANSG